MVFTEIWISEEENRFFNIVGFNSFFSNRSGGYGGTAILVKSNIRALKLCCTDNDYCQLLGVKLIDKDINLLSIYRSQKNKFQNFYILLEEYLRNSPRNLIVGDFNVNLLDSQDIDVMRYVELVYSLGYLFLNNLAKRYATRSKNSIDTIIDHVITDLFDFKYDLNISDTMLSDHKLLLLQVSNTQIPRQPKVVFHKILNWNNLFLDPAWSHLLNSVNLDDLVNNLSGVVERNTEVVKRYPSNNSNGFWLTNEIRLLLKERNRLFKLKRRYPCDIYIAEKHKLISATIARKIKAIKRKICNDNITINIDKPRLLWNYLKQIIYNKPQTTTTKIYISNGTKILMRQQEVVDEFNRYFVNVTADITSHLPNPKIEDFSNLYYNVTVPLVLNCTDVDEILNLLLGLKENSAIGVDKISTKFLKHTSNYVLPIIAKFINESFTTGIFPRSMKLARVLPVYKSGNETELSNYRPISILPSISKIYEKVVLKRLNNFLESNKIISDFQFGFTKNSSTVAACLNLTDRLSKQIDRKQYCGCLFLDMRKAFDSVHPDIMMIKLLKLNLSTVQLKLFKSYLSNRSQIVKIGEFQSTLRSVNRGVPQGSILGPALFNIYINDLTFIELEGQIQLFADDAVLTYSSESLSDLLRQINSDLSKVKNWFDVNHLVLNHSKTKYILFENRALDIDVINATPITYNSFRIERVVKYSYLGLMVDSRLAWTSHLAKIKKSIVPYIFALNRTKHLLPKKSLLQLYNAYIQSRLMYLSPIWSGCASYKIEELEILQKRALKYILHVPVRYPTQLLFKEFDSLRLLIERELLVLIHKIVNNLIKHNLMATNISHIHNHQTRRQSHYQIQFLSSSASSNNVV